MVHWVWVYLVAPSSDLTISKNEYNSTLVWTKYGYNLYLDLVKVKSVSKLISPDWAHPGPHVSLKMPAYGITQKQS